PIHGPSSSAHTRNSAIQRGRNFLGGGTVVGDFNFCLFCAGRDGIGGVCSAGSTGSQSSAGHLLGTDFAGRHALHGQVDSFVGVGTDLEGGGAEGAVQQLAATEAGGFGDAVQLGGQLAELGLHGLALIGAVRAVGGLQSQFA